jgi:hypothetical protein
MMNADAAATMTDVGAAAGVGVEIGAGAAAGVGVEIGVGAAAGVGVEIGVGVAVGAEVKTCADAAVAGKGAEAAAGDGTVTAEEQAGRTDGLAVARG